MSTISQNITQHEIQTLPFHENKPTEMEHSIPHMAQDQPKMSNYTNIVLWLETVVAIALNTFKIYTYYFYLYLFFPLSVGGNITEDYKVPSSLVGLSKYLFDLAQFERAA